MLRQPFDPASDRIVSVFAETLPNWVWGVCPSAMAASPTSANMIRLVILCLSLAVRHWPNRIQVAIRPRHKGLRALRVGSVIDQIRIYDVAGPHKRPSTSRILANEKCDNLSWIRADERRRNHIAGQGQVKGNRPCDQRTIKHWSRAERDGHQPSRNGRIHRRWWKT